MDSAACWSRRALLSALAGAGVGTLLFQRSLAALAAERGTVTPAMIEQAEWVAGLTLNDEQRQLAARAVNDMAEDLAAVRAAPLDPTIGTAVHFSPSPFGPPAPRRAGAVRPHPLPPPAAGAAPPSAEDLAWASIAQLGQWLRAKQVTAVDLAQLALARLRQYDGTLKCVVSLTEETALRQARQADAELAAGRDRGPLHGIPWGAKDLIAYPGYKTTWGAPQFANQTIDAPATVAARLDAAGAVLVAKLSLGALARGDQWFGGMTRNPWNPARGSSGSSAGSAAAVTAGLVPFALGSETLGSIISPSITCGCTGLRPTFGRVSRAGCMPLAWSLDKIGPLARSADDCALVLAAIHGADRLDPTALDQPFAWPGPEVRGLRVGYLPSEGAAEERAELKVLAELGVRLTPLEMPKDLPGEELAIILDVEAASVFEELSRAGVTEGLGYWPRAWRRGEFTPAVDYVRAQRVRTLLVRKMHELFQSFDAYLGGDPIVYPGFAGLPSIAFPGPMIGHGTHDQPQPLTLTGPAYSEATLLALVHAYQQATGHHLRRPKLAP